MNPLRWSGYAAPLTAAEGIRNAVSKEGKERPVKIESKSGHKVGPLASQRAIEFLTSLSMTPADRASYSAQVKIESKSGRKLGPLASQRAIELLTSLSMTPADRIAWATERAKKRLPAFKLAAQKALSTDTALHAHYGARADGFYLRFLQFNEVFPLTGDPDAEVPCRGG